MKEATADLGGYDINKLFDLEEIDVQSVLSNPNPTIEEVIKAYDYTISLTNIQFGALKSMLDALTKEKKYIIKKLKLIAIRIKTKKVFSKENITELNQLLEDINYYIKDIQNDYELIKEIKSLYNELVKYVIGIYNEELASIIKYYIEKFSIIYNEIYYLSYNPKDYVKLDFNTDEIEALNKDILSLGLGEKHE